MAGYMLTGDTREQCIFILFGDGSNGKTTFINTLKGLYGDYAIVTRVETLMMKNNTGATPELAVLRGARVVIASEAEHGHRFAEALVKQLTGGDYISTRHLYCAPFQMKPIFKILMSTNNKPEIQGDDYAIWRRIRLIPFDVTISPDKQDKVLHEKLITELPGILNWAIEGCKDWQKIGLPPPLSVQSATQQYKDEMNPIADWLNECCIQENGYVTNFSELFTNYRNWAVMNGATSISKQRMGRFLQKQDFKKEKVGGVIKYYGIKIIK